MLKNTITPLAACLLAFSAMGQSVQLTPEQYDDLKAAGALPAEFHLNYPTLPPSKVQPASGTERAGGGCNCWIEPDSTYALAMEPNDDWSSSTITLPFQFNLYGDLYSSCYINNNGNVSFLLPYSTFSASGFPTAGFRMVAPFWGDVDTRGAGTVKYKLTSNALYVNWTGVGYYAEQTDKLNTFQLIISDGTNTDVGIGNNVSFCYKEMQWTTGSASCTWDPGNGFACANSLGSYSCSPGDGLELGFCGVPATVGANRGVVAPDFAQFGRFNMPGMAYDGPFGNPDEVWWLSNKHFVFSTASSSSNLAPVASSSALCDTMHVCAGHPVDISVDFLAPEQGQQATASYIISPALNAPVTVVNTGPGNPSNIHLQFTPALSDTGLYVVTYTATDNGTPPMSSTFTVVLQVNEAPTVVPVITGPASVCQGATVELSASGNYPYYEWSNGQTGPTVTVGPGTYTVSGGPVGCGLLSDTFTVDGSPLPDPVIEGVLFNCGDGATLLSTAGTYSSYAWSNGATTSSISAGTGTYSVTVTNEFGCTGSSAPVNVQIADMPTAYFTGQPAGPAEPGTTITYMDQSTGNGATIVSWNWDAGAMGAGSGSSFTLTFNIPGSWPVTLAVTTSDGCVHTYTYVQVVVPEEIILPNVFSPNGDGHNDALVFEGAQYYPHASLEVFNRWGQVVFASANYKNTWRPGREIPDGTYFYILKLDGGKEYTGHVTLLR